MLLYPIVKVAEL